MRTKGLCKNNITFYVPMHPAGLRCEILKYLDIPLTLRPSAIKTIIINGGLRNENLDC